MPSPVNGRGETSSSCLTFLTVPILQIAICDMYVSAKLIVGTQVIVIARFTWRIFGLVVFQRPKTPDKSGNYRNQKRLINQAITGMKGA